MQQSGAGKSPSSQPGADQRPSPGDALATDAAEALARAQRQLQSMMRNAQAGRPSPAAQRQLLREALQNLEQGTVPSGRGAAPDNLTAKAREQLEKENEPLDLDLVRRLLAQLERVQMERLSDYEPDSTSPVTHTGPQNYPPGYRDWIQRYFRRLAEQP